MRRFGEKQNQEEIVDKRIFGSHKKGLKGFFLWVICMTFMVRLDAVKEGGISNTAHFRPEAHLLPSFGKATRRGIP